MLVIAVTVLGHCKSWKHVAITVAFFVAVVAVVAVVIPAVALDVAVVVLRVDFVVLATFW